MKIIYFILIFMIFNTEEVRGEKVLFIYNKEYMQYSYDNLTLIFGDIKKDSELKRILLSTELERFPYDGIEIRITDEKKLYYMITESKNSPLKEKKIINYHNQEQKSFFIYDYLIIEKNAPEIKYELKEKENPQIKKLFYGEIQLLDSDYKKIYKKIKDLDIKIKKYYKNQVIPSRRVEIIELVSKLGYVTEVSVLEDKIIYWEEEENILQNNEIYLELKGIKKELEAYIQKF